MTMLLERPARLTSNAPAAILPIIRPPVTTVAAMTIIVISDDGPSFMPWYSHSLSPSILLADQSFPGSVQTSNSGTFAPPSRSKDL